MKLGRPIGGCCHMCIVDDVFDLLDVLPLMASQPLPIEQNGSFEHLSRPVTCSVVGDLLAMQRHLFVAP